MLVPRTTTALADSAVLAPEMHSDGEHVYHLFVVRCTRRNELQEFLSERGIATGIHYPTPLHRTAAYSNSDRARSKPCPVAEQLADEILSLPMFPELTDEQLSQVTNAIHEFARNEGPTAPVDLARTN